MKLSVIVPVYRAEPFLRECVDSLLAQTLEDMEIIEIQTGDLLIEEDIVRFDYQ